MVEAWIFHYRRTSSSSVTAGTLVEMPYTSLRGMVMVPEISTMTAGITPTGWRRRETILAPLILEQAGGRIIPR
jgi:hypothetical protein